VRGCVSFKKWKSQGTAVEVTVNRQGFRPRIRPPRLHCYIKHFFLRLHSGRTGHKTVETQTLLQTLTGILCQVSPLTIKVPAPLYTG
jgi:hypothetical protein